MTTTIYRIARAESGWIIIQDGDEGMTYATQESAFEAAAAAASGDLRMGRGIRIEADTPTNPEGARDGGGVPIAGDGFSN